jgi:hypothetical protein
MNLTLIRKYPGTDCIIGELFVDGQFECYTLEDVERQVKIAGITAIPKGTYEVVITFSERFKKLLPLFLKIPNFEGVRIHTGNIAANTEGCILVGKAKTENQVLQSQIAFNELFPKLQAAVAKEKIFIEIKGS